jgi:hypothetical protein
MTSSVSCGVPMWVDDPTMDAQTPFRTYDVGTRVYNAGTAAANQVPVGVFPGLGAMGVTAAGGMSVNVNAGYCCVPNSSSPLQGGYIFGLMTRQALTVAAADPVNPRYDLVVASVQDLGSNASGAYVQVIEGIPAGTPLVPEVPANSMVLALLLVAAGVTSVTASAISDTRYYVVAPGGILPITNAAVAPAVPPTQFMYNLATNQLCQGTGVAGSVAPPSVLPWVPQIAVVTSNVLAPSAGALVTVASVSVTTDGGTDIEMYMKWAGLVGSASYITLGLYIDGTLADSINLQSLAGSSYGTQGGSFTAFTSGPGEQNNRPSATTHTIAWKLQAQGSGRSTGDGIVASSGAPAILRVAPVST